MPKLLGLTVVALHAALAVSAGVCAGGQPVSPVTQLAAALGPAYDIHRTDNFVIAYADSQQAWASQTGQLLERVRAHFMQTFDAAGFSVNSPSEPCVWVCFDRPEDFYTYAAASEKRDMSWTQSYYSARTNRVALLRPAPGAILASETLEGGCSCDANEDARKTAHELAHQLSFNTGLLKRGVMYPLWVAEGVATFFETSALSDDQEIAANESRLNRLADLTTAGRLMNVEDLAVLTSLPPKDEDRTCDIYAQCWALFSFLLKEQPTQLQKYLATLAALPAGSRSPQTIRAEFVRSFGPMAAVQSQWQHDVAALMIQAHRLYALAR